MTQNRQLALIKTTKKLHFANWPEIYNFDFLFLKLYTAFLNSSVSKRLYNSTASASRACKSLSTSNFCSNFLPMSIEFLGNFEKLSIRGQSFVVNSDWMKTSDTKLNFNASIAVNLLFKRTTSEAFDFQEFSERCKKMNLLYISPTA